MHFYYIVGLPTDKRHRKFALDLLKEAVVDQVNGVTEGSTPDVTLKYVLQPAEAVTGAGVGYIIFGKQAFVLACGTRPNETTLDGFEPSLLEDGWFWHDDAVARDLATSMSDWFDKFAMQRSRTLYGSNSLSFEQGRRDCESYFRSIDSVATHDRSQTLKRNDSDRDAGPRQ